ncbi:MAG: hypothetical protein J6Y08_09440 [Clostridiales bacterium]|nr:hypothetical protein [Clostridiales bacterium]
MISSEIILAGVAMQNCAIYTFQHQLNNLPFVGIGIHYFHGKQRQVIRISAKVSGKKIYKEFALTSPKAKDLMPLHEKRALFTRSLIQLQADADSLRRSLRQSTEAPPHMLVRTTNFTYEDFQNLQELADKNIKNGYKFGRHVFRSKSELTIAELLHSLGLEYKYEPIVTLGGTTWHPDFAVYCPETGRFFYIEHLGLMDNTRYKSDNIEKMARYEEAGWRQGIDIIYTMEFGQGMLDTDAVLGQIIGAVIAQSRKNT